MKIILNLDSDKRIRTIELILVMSVAFLPHIIHSIFVLIGYTSLTSSSSDQIILNILRDITIIGFLFYVLFRQGRTIVDLGFSFQWRDVPLSVKILVSIFLAVFLYQGVVYYLYFFITGQKLVALPHTDNIYKNIASIFSFNIYLIINAFYEEIFVRAYMMTEIEYLTNNKGYAVLLSCLVHTSYHLYLGLLAASSTMIFALVVSLYYMKSKRLIPIVLAHLIYDLIAFYK